MSTDAIIPSADELTRSTELPAQELQRAEEAKDRQQVFDLTSMPGWRVVEQTFVDMIAKYEKPVFTPDTPLEQIGREYLMSQTVAGRLQEAFDAIRAAAKG